MYHWIEDKHFLSEMRSLCSDTINRLVQVINRDGEMEVRQHLVGSGARNLITQNEKEPIDLDYNLEIVDFGSFSINDCRQIKEYIQNIFDEVLSDVDWGHCQNSTSALTTDKNHFTEGNPTEFSIDLCIVQTRRDGSWYRLICDKIGSVQFNRYYWNEAHSSRGLEDRVAWLKENGFWIDLRETYLKKKNIYLSRNDHDHSSFIIYIESVNEVFSKYNSRGFIHV